MLIVAGKNDTVVPVSQSERIAAALRRSGVPVQLHIFPNEGHGVSNLTNLMAIYRWMTAFMQQYAHPKQLEYSKPGAGDKRTVLRRC